MKVLQVLAVLLLCQPIMAKTVIVKEGGRIYSKNIQVKHLDDKVTAKIKPNVRHLSIGLWRPLQPGHFQLISKESNNPLIQFQCGLEDAQIKVVKTLTGEIVLRTDSRVKLNMRNAFSMDEAIFQGSTGKKRLELLNHFWLACRNAAVEYQSDLENLIAKVTPRLNSKTSYGYTRMPASEKIARTFLIPKAELFKKWQNQLCKQHQLLSANIPVEWNWKTEPCYLQ